MRIAALADIHGNLPALEAALENVKGAGVDHIVVLGDIVVGGPDSTACWERVKGLCCPVLRGNHERYVIDYGTDRAPAHWSSRQFAPVQYAAAALGATRRSELAALPGLLALPECPDLLFVHGSARSDCDLVFPYTPDAELEPMFAGHAHRWILRGHNHYAGVRLWGDRRIVTVGSVGLPLDGTPGAHYTMIDGHPGRWSVSHQKVAYDVEATGRRFRESGYLEAAGPMAKLYLREVLTASFHIVPFLAWYGDARKSQPDLTLEQAVSRFCPAAD